MQLLLHLGGLAIETDNTDANVQRCHCCTAAHRRNHQCPAGSARNQVVRVTEIGAAAATDGSGASAGFSYDSDSKKGLRMTKPITRDPIYRRRVFDAEVIELCVRWYITYRLSYRDLVAMMAERGVTVAHSTILML